MSVHSLLKRGARLIAPLCISEKTIGRVERHEEVGRTVDMENFIRDFLKEDRFSADVTALLEMGMGKDDIKKYYWSCATFRALWTSIELEEGHLDTIINDAILKYSTV